MNGIKATVEKHSWPNAIAEHGFHNVYTGQLLLEEEKNAIIGTTLWTDFFGGNPITTPHSRESPLVTETTS